MNIKRHQLTIDIITIVMHFIPVYLFTVIVLYKFTSYSPLKSLILLPTPILSYLIKRYTHHIWSFLILHAAMAVIYFTLVSDSYLRIAIGIYLVILTIRAYYTKNPKKEQEKPSPVLLILFVIFYIACYLLHIPELFSLCFSLSIVYTLLYIVNRYLLNLETFVDFHKEVTNIPFRQIKNTNNVLMVFLNCLFLVTMLLFSLLPLGGVLTTLRKVLVGILRYLFSLFSFKESENILPPEVSEYPLAMEDLPVTEPSRFMELIMAVLQWVMIIFVIALVVALLVYALYQIYQYFYLKSEDEVKDTIEFLSPFSSKERVKREPKKSIRGLFGRSNNAQIRKHFTLAVTSSLTPNTKLEKSLTPSELSSVILSSSSKPSAPLEEEGQALEQIDRKKQITEYYEKARYSNEECSKDEVLRLKKLLRKNK